MKADGSQLIPRKHTETVVHLSVPRYVFLNLVTSSSGKPTPELRFMPGRLRWTLFPKSAAASHTVPVVRTPNPPIERRTSHHCPNQSFVANA